MRAQARPSPFLSADWGSTYFRLQVLADAGTRCLASHSSTQGAAALAAAAGPSPSARADAFADCLRNALAVIRPQIGVSLDARPVVISGMAASAYGWCESPYQPLPFTLDGRGFACVHSELATPGAPPHPLYFLSGVCRPDDVMRGEETQLVGLVQHARTASLPHDFLALLPGTHCKHALVQAGQLVDFQTFMTGELYALLALQSVLRHTVGAADATANAAEHGRGFDHGLATAREAGLAAGLFQTRACGVLGAATPTDLAGYLSGLLIGSELDGRLLRTHLELPILLVADSTLSPLYARTLQSAGLDRRLHIIPPDVVPTLAGLGQAAFLQHVAT